MTNQTIVVVDEDPAYLTLIHEFLSDEGYPRVVCTRRAGAGQAISCVRPGVVLLEIHASWPTWGLQLLEWLRSEPRTALLPVIICTTSPRLLLAHSAHLPAPGCDILEKPFQLEDLLARIQARIGRP